MSSVNDYGSVYVTRVVEPGQNGSPTIVEVINRGNQGLSGTVGAGVNVFEYEADVVSDCANAPLFYFPLNLLPNYNYDTAPGESMRPVAELKFRLEVRDTFNSDGTVHSVSAIVNIGFDTSFGGAGPYAEGRVLNSSDGNIGIFSSATVLLESGLLVFRGSSNAAFGGLTTSLNVRGFVQYAGSVLWVGGGA